MDRALYRHAALCKEVVFDQRDAARTLKVEAPLHSMTLAIRSCNLCSILARTDCEENKCC
jgi:hypothetical protein